MKPFYIYCNWICDVASWINGFQIDGLEGIPFISIVRKGTSWQLKNHEAIHNVQQLECFIIAWYFIYGFEYIANRFKMDHYSAYKMIRFEQEAYMNENNATYLDTRKHYAWRTL